MADLRFDIDVDGRRGIDTLESFTRQASRSMQTLGRLTRTVGAFGAAARAWDYLTDSVREYAKADGNAARSIATWDSVGKDLKQSIGAEAAPAFGDLVTAAKAAERSLNTVRGGIVDALSTIFSGDAFGPNNLDRIRELQQIRELEALQIKQAADFAAIRQRNETVLKPKADQTLDMQRQLVVEVQANEVAKQRVQAEVEREQRLARIDQIQRGLTVSEQKSLEIAGLRAAVEQAYQLKLTSAEAQRFAAEEDQFQQLYEKSTRLRMAEEDISDQLDQNRILELRLTNQDRLADRMLLEIQYRKQLQALENNTDITGEDYTRAKSAIEASRDRALEAFDNQSLRTRDSSSLRGIGGAGGELFTSGAFRQAYFSAGAGKPPTQAIVDATEKTAEEAAKQTEQGSEMISEIKGIGEYIKSMGGLGHFNVWG